MLDVCNEKHIEFNALDFYQQMLSCKEGGVDLVQIRNTEGLSVLHLLARKGRNDYMSVLYDMGIFEFLVDEIVLNPMSEFHNMTARQIAVKFGFYACQDEIDKLVQFEESLNTASKLARIGNFIELEKLLKQDSSQISESSALDHSCPMTWAVVANSWQCVEVLIANGAPVTHSTKQQKSLLSKACVLGHEELVAKLICICNLDINEEGHQNRYPIESVAEMGNFMFFEEMLKKGAFYRPLVLHSAAAQGRADFLKRLVDTYPTLVDINYRDPVGQTALHYAACYRSFSCIRVLLEKGADFTILDACNRSILHLLAERGCTEACLFVLKFAKKEGKLNDIINVQELYTGRDCIHLLRSNVMIRPSWQYVLVDRCFSWLFKQDSRMGMALVNIDKYGFRLLNGWGISPPEKTRNFIKEMCRVTKTKPNPKADMTVLHVAILAHDDLLCYELLEHGACCNVQDRFGLYPLHLAAMNGMLKIVQKIESTNADMTVKDHKKRSAITIAEANNQMTMVKYLRNGTDIRNLYNLVQKCLAISIKFDPLNLGEMKKKGENISAHAIPEIQDLVSHAQELLYKLKS